MNYATPFHRIAWPFEPDADRYRYTTNVVGARTRVATPAGGWGDTVMAVDETYDAVLAYRREILARDPRRRQVAPHLEVAEWDALLFVLGLLAEDHPSIMRLTREPDGTFRWENQRSGTIQTFAFGDPASLPTTPFAFVAGEAVEDLFLLEPRDGHLILEGAASTFAGSWSPIFDMGMPFAHLHGPVPRLHGLGILDRTERFLLGLPPGEIVRRTNWSLHGGVDLDASLENAVHRDRGRPEAMRRSGDYSDLRLRIEVQHLVRLPMSGCLLFLIENQLCPLDALATIPAWSLQLATVVEALPDDIAAYKGIDRFRPDVVRWLRDSVATSRLHYAKHERN